MAIPIDEPPQILENEPVDNVIIPEKLLQFVNGKHRENMQPKRKMQKVPSLLRLDKKNQQDYDPAVVSLGPYHHGKKELQLAEDFKLITLQMFVDGSGHDALFFYSQVLQLAKDARHCYIEDYTKEYDDQTFAQMMFLDACFIINYLVQIKSYPNLYMTRYHLGYLVSSVILRDLFLLENQIPFIIVNFLMCLRYGEEQADEMLNEFLNGVVFGELKGSGTISTDEELPFHLLEAFWLILVSEPPKDTPITEKISSNNAYSQFGCLKQVGNLVKCSHIRQCITMLPCFSWRKRKRPENDNSAKKYVHFFRSATDLKAKGIHFRPSGADSLKAIKFKPGHFYAILELPIWLVSIYAKVFFLNLIAYEMCPNSCTDRIVTAYVEFLKSIIDSPEDVKELREKRILFTTLGSDEEVVKVYKEINSFGLNNASIFHNVNEEIQAHYSNRGKTWLAELFDTYFRSPWTALALFAATCLLVLTFLQTYYTIKAS